MLRAHGRSMAGDACFSPAAHAAHHTAAMAPNVKARRMDVAFIDTMSSPTASKTSTRSEPAGVQAAPAAAATAVPTRRMEVSDESAGSKVYAKAPAHTDEVTRASRSSIQGKRKAMGRFSAMT